MAPSQALGPTVSGYPTFLLHLSHLIPLQRSLLLLNLQKAHYFYSIEVQDRLSQLGWAATPVVKNDSGALWNGQAESAEGTTSNGVSTAEVPSSSTGATASDQPKPPTSSTAAVPSPGGQGELKAVYDLLVQCGLWSMVTDKEEEAELELKSWGQSSGPHQLNGQFQAVQISGLPFVLYLPPGYTSHPSTPPPSDPYKALKRAQTIHHILTTLLQLLVTYQPSAPAIAYGRALLRPGNGSTSASSGRARAEGAVPAAGAAPPPPPPVVGGAAIPGAGGGVIPVRRRATISIVINLEAMLSILVPLFLLSLKLAFLLWIFGRHASSTKRIVLVGLAVGYVVWEGWAMQRRRAGVGRERVEREVRRRQAGAGGAGAAGAAAAAGGQRRPAAAAAGGAANGEDAQLPAPARGRGEEGGENGVAARPPNAAARPNAPPPPAAPPRIRPPPSRWTPKYWLNWVAAIGLAEEARELGLVPRSIAGRLIVNHPPRGPNAPLPSRTRRAVRTAMVAIVLFFGTLSPEVEKKRKRALEKREKLLLQRKQSRERKRIAAALAAAAANVGGGTAGGGGGGGAEGEGVGGEGDAQRPAVNAVHGALERMVANAVEAGVGNIDGLAPPPAVGATASGTSTPGVFEAVENPLEEESADSPASSAAPTSRAPPSTATLPQATAPVMSPPVTAAPPPTPPMASESSAASTALPVPSAAVTPDTPAGRAAISDAVLFADGLGEPEQVAEVPMEEDFGSGEVDGEGGRGNEYESEHERAIAEGRVDETETDDEGQDEEGQPEGEVDQIVALF